MEAVVKVPVWTREKLDQYLDFIKGFIEMIAGYGLSQLKEIEAQRIMRENEKRNLAIIQSTSDWIWELDRHGKYSYCSERVESILGYKAEEIIGKSPHDLMPKNERESINVIFQTTSETKEPLVNLENWKLHKNGNMVCLLTNVSPVLDKTNKIIGYIGSDKDITERKHKEEALQRSEEKLRASNLIIEGIINSIPARVFWKDKNLVYLGCNTAFAIDGGYSHPKDIVGKDDFQMGWSDQAELYRCDDRYVIGNGCAKLNIEEPQTTPDGKTITLLTSKIPLRNSAGEITGILGTYMDITEQKAVEQKAQENELKFRTVADYTFNWEYWQGEDQQIRYMSPSCERITGYTPDEFISNPGLLQEIIHPDDLNAFRDHQKQIIHDDHPLHTCDFDYRVIHKGGAIVYINHLCRPVFDEYQQYIGRRVSNIDITERVLKEKDLIATKNSLLLNEEKFRVLFDTMTEGVALNEIIYNEKHEMIDYRILEVNKTFYQLTNTTPEEVINNVATQIYGMPGELIKSFWEQHKIANETTFSEMQSPVDEDKWFYVSTSPFKDDKFVTVFFDITDRKREERHLRESEDKFRTISEQSVDLIALTDNNGIITYVSSVSKALFRYEPDEMCGRKFMEFLYESSIPKAIDAFQNTLRSGESVKNLELTMKRKDGSLFEGDLSGSIFKSGSQIGTLVNIHDITERKLAEKALLDSEKLYRNLVVSSLDGVYKSTHEGKFVEVNPALVKMLGYENKEELMAIDIKTQLYFEPADRESLIQQELLEETGVYRMKKKDGSELWVEDHAWYDFDENGDILYHEGIIRDVTDRKLAEDTIRLLNETLEVRIAERTQQFEAVNKELAFHVDELEQFAYVSNHDLSEPLRTLTQFTQLLQDEYSGKLDEDGNKYIEFIYNSGLRMKELVTGLFNYTLLGRDRIITAIDCNILVNAVLSDLDHSIKVSNGKVTVQELPTVNGFETELRLLFQNLIANAIKFHRDDESPEIKISAANSENEWIFSIQDNGVGIEPKYKDKVFIIFQRLHKRNEFSGTGIGLAHCKKVVELHGGKIWVESTPGEGSNFMFTIPKNNHK
jgi:PAS domain S-box-containing protein